MSFKFKQLKNPIKNLEKSINDIKREFINSMAENAKEIIIDDNIKKGFSPVKNQGRYESYSKSYKEAIRKGRTQPKTTTSPVNLTLSGQMLNSFEVKKTPKGISMEFPDELAKYHNELGAGKSKVIRQMLPRGNQEFKASITKQLIDLLKQAVETIVAKIK